MKKQGQNYALAGFVLALVVFPPNIAAVCATVAVVTANILGRRIYFAAEHA